MAAAFSSRARGSPQRTCIGGASSAGSFWKPRARPSALASALFWKCKTRSAQGRSPICIPRLGQGCMHVIDAMPNS